MNARHRVKGKSSYGCNFLLPTEEATALRLGGEEVRC